MAHGENARAQCSGREYWKSRLHRHGEIPGRLTKKLTAKKERRRDRSLCVEGLAELDIGILEALGGLK